MVESQRTPIQIGTSRIMYYSGINTTSKTMKNINSTESVTRELQFINLVLVHTNPDSELAFLNMNNTKSGRIVFLSFILVLQNN